MAGSKKRALGIIILLLIQLLLITGIPLPLVPVMADAAVDAQPIWAQCNDNDYPDGYQGVDNDAENIENRIKGSIVNHTDLWGYQADWDFNVTQLRAFVEGGTNNEPGSMAAYEFVSVTNAGDLWGQADGTVSQYSVWNYFHPDDPISLPSGEDPQYWVTIWMGSELGSFLVREDTNIDGETLDKSLTYTGTYPDPLSGEATGGNSDFWVRGFITAFTENTTSHNYYYGNAENYTARRDVIVDMPPSGVSNREIRYLYPATESLLNITYENGGGWDAALTGAEYSEAEFNATHQELTIPDASIGSYGYSFRSFTTSKAAVFTLTGPLYENGTAYGSYITVTAHLSGETSQEFNVSGTPVVKGWDTMVLLFSWGMPGGGTRLFYPMASGESIVVYLPEGDYAVYSFDIKDYSQKVGTQNSWLEVHRFISGSDEIIERHLIQNVLTDVPAFLVIDQAYLLRAILSDDSIQSFGFFVAGAETEPILIIQLVTFSDQVHNSQAYVLFEASRSEDGVTIQGEFTNDGNNTSYLIFEVRYLNDSVVYDDDLVDTNTALFQWTQANNVTDYYVWMRCTTPSTYVGNVTYIRALPRVAQALTGWNMSTVSSTDRSEMIPIGILLGAASLAGAAHVIPGLLVTIILAATFNRWGWITLPDSLIVGAICFMIIFALARLKREYGM